MLTMEDCIALSDLTEDEIEAIAEHEHIPQMAAVELGWYLVQTPEGERRIKRMIIDDMVNARERGDHAHAAKLKLVLQHFVEEHTAAA
ncbi:hypothetical protein [Aquisalimonas sp.]|uniref:hypothetical protein n=1 Tax=Aquisalimonas sp. TaxID=1872621 RepID=UPI0025BCC9CF|nr:hypothetical protein [Aquisalimonas sp.]